MWAIKHRAVVKLAECNIPKHKAYSNYITHTDIKY